MHQTKILLKLLQNSKSGMNRLSRNYNQQMVILSHYSLYPFTTTQSFLPEVHPATSSHTWLIISQRLSALTLTLIKYLARKRHSRTKTRWWVISSERFTRMWLCSHRWKDKLKKFIASQEEDFSDNGISMRKRFHRFSLLKTSSSLQILELLPLEFLALVEEASSVDQQEDLVNNPNLEVSNSLTEPEDSLNSNLSWVWETTHRPNKTSQICSSTNNNASEQG